MKQVTQLSLLAVLLHFRSAPLLQIIYTFTFCQALLKSHIPENIKAKKHLSEDNKYLSSDYLCLCIYTFFKYTITYQML